MLELTKFIMSIVMFIDQPNPSVEY